jgi:ABC-2 type transport system permease protein
MRTLRFLLQKEFRQIFRNPSIIKIIFIMPLVQLLILPLAADYEIKDVRITIIDHDHSSYSRQLTDRIVSSGYFLLQNNASSYRQALTDIEEDKADLILEVPASFERTIIRENQAPLYLAVNAINGSRAGLGAGYLQSIVQEYNRELRLKWIHLPKYELEPSIKVISTNWFNQSLNYKLFMVPGILVVLVTMVGSFLA